MSESPSQCAHQWVTSEDPLISLAFKNPVIGWGSRDMLPGRMYHCVNCKSRVFIKHRGTLMSTIRDTSKFEKENKWAKPSLFAASCVCGFRIPATDYLPGHQGREYVLSHMRRHVEECNRKRVKNDSDLHIHSPQTTRG